MASLTYRTAGESHGRALISVIEGMPAGVTLDVDLINSELRRRQGGYGRGGRQKIETDIIEILSGVRRGKTIGSPIALQLINKDSRLDDAPPLHRPRPGHADLAGSIKWLTTDCRETLERASARETAARVAAGALSRCFLKAFGIEVFGFVRTVGQATAKVEVTEQNWRELLKARDASEVYTPDAEADELIGQIEQAAGRTVEATRSVDPALIGGFVLRAGSYRADASVRGRLERLRQELVRS